MKNLLRAAFPGNCVLSAETLRRASARSKLYVIFLTPRSGSTWLTELALKSGVLGCPQEWFNDGWIYTDEIALGCLPPRRRGISDINAYVDAIVDEGCGTAGLELSIYQALMLGEMLDEPFDAKLLDACFYLRRKDRVAQAISLYRSVSSGYFHSYQRDPDIHLRHNKTQYDFDQILSWIRQIEDCELQFEALFSACQFDPIRIYYENLCSSPVTIVNKICTAVGVPSINDLPETSLNVLRDEISADWQSRFAHEFATRGNISLSSSE